MDEDTEAARMASVKLSDGDVHGAIRILSSVCASRSDDF